jgi:hypothetical protein
MTPLFIEEEAFMYLKLFGMLRRSELISLKSSTRPPVANPPVAGTPGQVANPSMYGMHSLCKGGVLAAWALGA